MRYLQLFETYYNKDIPIKLYHSSDFKFKKFELRKGYRTHLIDSMEVESLAIFLTDDIAPSREYGNSYTYECGVISKKSLDWSEYIDEISYSWITTNLGDIIPYDTVEYWSLLDDTRVVEYLKKRGVDCVLLTEYSENVNDVFMTYAIFDPNNIRILNRIKNM